MQINHSTTINLNYGMFLQLFINNCYTLIENSQLLNQFHCGKIATNKYRPIR